MLVPVLLAAWVADWRPAPFTTLASAAGGMLIFNGNTGNMVPFTDGVFAIATTSFLFDVVLICVVVGSLRRKRIQIDIERTAHEVRRLLIERIPAELAMFDKNMRYITATEQWKRTYGLDEVRAIEGLGFRWRWRARRS